jgi:hypothetical protein
VRARFVVGCDGGSSTVRKLAGIGFPGIGPSRLPITGTRWMSRFTDATRQADRYRAGRVLLAGDAAHIHLPAGGPGLNTGLQDAFNLGWKLAAEIHGWAPKGLLDSYHTERHAEGARVLLHTRAQGALAQPDERVASLRALFGELLQDAATTRRVAGLLYSLDTRYDMGGGQTHPLVGRWAPEIGAAHHDAKAVLVGAKCPGWEDRVVAIPAGSGEAMLVRPDGYVAWAGSPDDGSLQPALQRWFGSPTT